MGHHKEWPKEVYTNEISVYGGTRTSCKHNIDSSHHKMDMVNMLANICLFANPAAESGDHFLFRSVVTKNTELCSFKCLFHGVLKVILLTISLVKIQMLTWHTMPVSFLWRSNPASLTIMYKHSFHAHAGWHYVKHLSHLGSVQTCMSCLSLALWKGL